jgi:uncharacterized protein YqjF (DUF2071 family)
VSGSPDSSPCDSAGGSLDIPLVAPRLLWPIFTHQHWADLTFVHWPVEAEAVAHMYPAGTRPDVFADGMTYVGLVPFAMNDVALGFSRPIPYFGRFLETNVRLYSTDDDGHHGVLFRSLETARLAVVPVTRITYDSVRRWPHRGLRSRLTVDVGAVVDPTPLEFWLTARWGAHTRQAGRTWWVPNEHEPFPLHSAEVIELDSDLVPASGVSPAGAPMRALFSPGVRARFGRPVPISARTRPGDQRVNTQLPRR